MSGELARGGRKLPGVRWQPDPADDDPMWSPAQWPPPVPGGPPMTQPRRPRPRRKAALAAVAVLLVAGLCGLGIAAVGAAHQLLPRQFTAAQQRKIEAWEVSRRWLVFPAGKIFPATVTYRVPGSAFYSARGLALAARRLSIATSTTCAPAVSKVAARILGHHGCKAVLRATYLDASGTLVATVGVAVLPDSDAAQAVVTELGHRPSAEPLTSLPVARTLAAGFGDPQRQLSRVTAAGPYVILSTAGFADGRRRVDISSDGYLDDELTSLAAGLSASASSILGSPPPTPTCPGSPGC